MAPKTGLLFLNLGTPDKPETREVRRYLRQFLNDPRVIDIPALGRWLLLNLIILPFRPKQSAHAYQTIWTKDGSPLLLFTQALADEVAAILSKNHTVSVRIGMRYQNPSIGVAMEAFRKEGVEKLIVFPLYPQYASSSTGSCLQEVYDIAGKLWNVPNLVVVPPYYDHPGFVESLATVAKETLPSLDQFDKFLFSYHGLPERQIRKSDLDPNGWCLAKAGCCDAMNDANRYCYRAQSYATSHALAKSLGIAENRYEVAFQSRLGRTPWIQPYTDERLKALPKEGVRKLAVMVPSFASDCLETLEEIGIRGEETFKEAGGEELTLVPCVNAHPFWATSVAQMLEPYLTPY